MPFQPSSRPSFALASALAAAGLTLTVAGCSQLTPLGPTPPQPSHLGSPIVLQAIRSQPATPAGRCPAGYVVLATPGNLDPGLCFRKLGTPVTITSAAVSSVSEGPTTTPAGPQARSGSTPVSGQARPVGTQVSQQARPVGTPASQQARPVSTPASQQAPRVPYGFAVVVPAADVAAVTAVIARAYDSRGAVSISVAGKTWAAPHVIRPFPGRQFQIFLPSRNQALQLRRILVPSG